MPKQDNYICKIATLEEITDRWDYEASLHPQNLLYPFAKKEYVEEAAKGNRITYVGILNGNIICDATAVIKKEGILNEAGDIKNIVNEKRVFLCGVRTNKEYENQKYFSRLYHFIEEDLRKKGYEEISLSVDITEKRNIEIYKHLGYTNLIGTEIREGKNKSYTYNYYYKDIKNVSI